MVKRFVQPGVGTILAGAVMTVGLLAAGAACAGSAMSSPARVDVTQPHTQLYPESAQASGEEGTVLVNVYVAPNGKVAKYNVAQSSGFGDLDNAALESVLNWRFVPAMRDGDTVADWLIVKLVYQLPQAPVQATSPSG